MLSRTQFVKLLTDRRANGDTLSKIGEDFGVSKQAVQQWITGGTPSDTVLLLAEMLVKESGANWPL